MGMGTADPSHVEQGMCNSRHGLKPEIHVTPVNDIQEHAHDSVECWCTPRIDRTPGLIPIIVHIRAGQEPSPNLTAAILTKDDNE